MDPDARRYQWLCRMLEHIGIPKEDLDSKLDASEVIAGAHGIEAALIYMEATER